MVKAVLYDIETGVFGSKKVQHLLCIYTGLQFNVSFLIIISNET